METTILQATSSLNSIKDSGAYTSVSTPNSARMVAIAQNMRRMADARRATITLMRK